jgi:hypothetical protein
MFLYICIVIILSQSLSVSGSCFPCICHVSLVFGVHLNEWWPIDASVEPACPCGCNVVSFFFQCACPACVILASSVESMCSAVATHALRLGVLLCLAAAV